MHPLTRGVKILKMAEGRRHPVERWGDLKGVGVKHLDVNFSHLRQLVFICICSSWQNKLTYLDYQCISLISTTGNQTMGCVLNVPACGLCRCL